MKAASSHTAAAADAEHPDSGKDFRMEVRVRYPETDPMGVVHHANFFVYFEMARVEHLRSFGVAYKDLERQGIFFAVVKASCHLKAPAYYDDILEVTLRLERSSLVRVDHSYAVRRKSDAKLLAEGATVLACLDRNFNPQPMPDRILSIFRGISPS